MPESFKARKLGELCGYVNDRIALLERIAEESEGKHAQFWARLKDLKRVRSYLVDIRMS